MGNDIILSLIWGVISMCNGLMCLTLGYIIGKRKQTIFNHYTIEGDKTRKTFNDNDIDFPNSRKK